MTADLAFEGESEAVGVAVADWKAADRELAGVGRDRDTARAALGQGLAVSAFPRYVPV
jgi:hypothetical protein